MTRRLASDDFFTPDFPLHVVLAGIGPAGAGLHTHDFFELVFVERGAGAQNINGKPYAMLRGDFFFMRPEDEHRYNGSDELRVTNILFNPAIFSSQWASILALPGLGTFLSAERAAVPHKLALGPRHQELVRAITARLRREQQEQAAGWQVAMQADLSRLLVLLARVASTYGGAGWSENLAPVRVAAVIQTIHRCYSEELTVAELAHEAGWSTNYFGEQFKQATGLSVTQYLNQVRVDHARLLLDRGEHSVTEIAFAVGYNDASYFGRVFKQLTGVSPREYLVLAADPEC